MKTIDKKQVLEIIPKDGTVFGVTFIKKNGELRRMSARLGVKKGVKGVGRSYDPASLGLIGVYDMNNGFRMVNLDTVTELVVNKQKIKVV